MTEVPDVQRAWVVTAKGKPKDALQLKTNWPVQKKLNKGDVLVKIQAGALNPVGWKLMKYLPNFMAKRPHIAEHDFSGVIVDANGTEFDNGDAVYGWIPSEQQQKTRQGVLAEYSRVPSDHLVRRPSNITPVQASGITLTAMTAYQGLFEVAKLEPQQTILINGGSTAVGSYAIQFAKAKGCKVVAVASGKNEEYVRKLGADEFIDYTKVSLHQYLTENAPTTKFNVIFETVGLFDPSLYTYSESYLAPNGIFVTAGPLPENFNAKAAWQFLRLAGALCSPSFLSGIKAPWRIVLVKNKLEDLKTIAKLVEEGKLKPQVDSVYEFEDVLKAYDRIMTHRATGKVVVKVDPSAD